MTEDLTLLLEALAVAVVVALLGFWFSLLWGRAMTSRWPSPLTIRLLATFYIGCVFSFTVLGISVKFKAIRFSFATHPITSSFIVLLAISTISYLLYRVWRPWRKKRSSS